MAAVACVIQVFYETTVLNMQSKWTVIQCLTLIFSVVNIKGVRSNLAFPDSFLFGASTSSYQVEGAWNTSGKGPSRWDYLTHNVPIIEDGSTGDVAADSYHRYKEDIAALKELGVNFYRFSISWPRILPSGFVNEVNQDGVKYYNNLINGLLAEGIEPWVTMYHYEMPLPLYYLGGWNNAKIVEYFTDYADLLFRLFGDRVKTWLTLNEPYMFCAFYVKVAVDSSEYSYVATGISEYLCGHNALRSHAKVYRLYEAKYRAIQKGRVSIVLNMEYPLSGADSNVATRTREFFLGWFLHPLVYGDYPQTMIDVVGNLSSLQGYPSSRLPKLTDKEKAEIKGAYDFVAINHYSSAIVTSNNSRLTPASFENDADYFLYQPPSWKGSASSWLKVYPKGFRQLLQHIKQNYGNLEIAVTEQGFSEYPNVSNDTRRIDYYQVYLNELLEAINEDGIRVTAYTAWSLVDSFEWVSGYTIGFGLYQVDLENKNRTRIPKESAKFYKNVIATRRIVASGLSDY